MINIRGQGTQSQRVITIANYTLFAIVSVRIVLNYSGQVVLIPLLALLAIFLLLLITEPGMSRRWGSTYLKIYFCLQTVLIVCMGLLAPSFDFLPTLYIILAIQAFLYFPRRAATIWIGVLVAIAGLFLTRAVGVALGLAILLNLIAVSIFMVSFVRASWQAELARNESAALLHELQTAHAQLQDYAAQAEELSAVRERIRVARELHDSVNQTIFSITLTAEAARSVLDKDPARVPPYLDQLQATTGSALAQLRSLIGQLRPRPQTDPLQRE